MEGQGRQIGGLTLVLMGVLGVCVACGLPMWRETSFVGSNIVTAQSVSWLLEEQRSNTAKILEVWSRTTEKHSRTSFNRCMNCLNTLQIIAIDQINILVCIFRYGLIFFWLKFVKDIKMSSTVKCSQLLLQQRIRDCCLKWQKWKLKC